MSLYLLDANVLIDANRDYYPIARVPEFWDWLEHYGKEGRVKIPVEIYNEVEDGNDDLAEWAKRSDIKKFLRLDEEPAVDLVQLAIETGYASDLKDDELLKLGRDPFLIAYALVAPSDRWVVTTEKTKRTQKRANSKIPDVCEDLGIPCCDTFAFLRALNFKTGWRSG